MSNPSVKNLLRQFEGRSQPVVGSNQQAVKPGYMVSGGVKRDGPGLTKTSGRVKKELESKFESISMETSHKPADDTMTVNTSKVKLRRPQQSLTLHKTVEFDSSNETENGLRSSLSPKSQEIVDRGNITKFKRQQSNTLGTDGAVETKKQAVAKLNERIAQVMTRENKTNTAESRFSYENVFPSSGYVNAKQYSDSGKGNAVKHDIGKFPKPCRPQSPSLQDMEDTAQKCDLKDNSKANMLSKKGQSRDLGIDDNSSGIGTSRVLVDKLKTFDADCDENDVPIKPHVHILPEHTSAACRDADLLNRLEKALEKQPVSKSPPKPCKPPRTFAHDVYVKDRTEKSKTAPVSKNSSIIFHKYEDILPTSERRTSYEEIPEDIVIPHRPARPARPPTLPHRPGSKMRISSNSYESIPQSFSDEAAVSQPFGVRRNNNAHRGTINAKEEWMPRKKRPVNVDPHAPLRRTYSDECVYMDARKVLSGISRDPVYQDPSALDSMSFPPLDSHTAKMVQIDRDGYAVPELTTGGHKTVQRMATNPELGLKQKITGLKNFFAEGAKQLDNKKKAVPVGLKISRAFSVLRKAVKHERSGTGDSNDEDADNTDGASVESESLVDEEEQKKRLKYVASVREKNYMTLEALKKNREKIYPQLFEYALVVGLRPQAPHMNTFEPYIMHKFPPQVKDDNAAIPQFCFPDATEWRPVLAYNTETFSFVLTNIDGTRLYGYCLRLLPGGFRKRLPEVYCIISPLDAHGLYLQVLDEIERRRINVTYDNALQFIAAAYTRPLPSSGKYVHITTPASQPSVLTLKREADFRLEDVDFETVLNKLGVETTLEVFASLLLERRVLFTASKLSTLSACIHALVALLYPFTWQHTFIPVLPSSLIDIVCSPTPYIIGILSSCRNMLTDLPMEEVLIVDIDHGELLQGMGDEDTLIPRKLQKALKMALKDEGESENRNLVISEAFMRLFVETIGCYADYVNVQQNGENVFQRDCFIKSIRSKSLRMFVEWFCETQMFEVFMTDILENAADSHKVIFEKRIVDYQEEMSGDRFTDNVREFGKRVKNIGKAIRHKFKEGKS